MANATRGFRKHKKDASAPSPKPVHARAPVRRSHEDGTETAVQYRTGVRSATSVKRQPITSNPGGKPHGVNKIVTAHDTLIVNGVPVAAEGCTTECGCKLLGSLPATVN